MLNNLIKERLEKLVQYKELFGNPYPARVKRSFVISEAIEKFSVLEKSSKKIFLVGRILSLRIQGKIVFSDAADETGKFQFVFNEEKTKNFSEIKKIFDIGDFIEAEGVVFLTKRGEKSLLVSKARLISKCLRPWPSSWYGIEDIEARERQRYLDFIFHPEAKEKILLRFRLENELRKILAKDGFLEVETPILQPLPGGAIARPFNTHFNALDINVYLRIAPELYLKRLLVAGFEKIFEIAKDFRNEGIDRDHYPEFIMLELYWAYQDYNGIMDAVQKWLVRLAKKLEVREFSFRGNLIKNFFSKWQKIDYSELIKRYSGKNLSSLKLDEIDAVFKKKVRPNIIEPTFVVNYPKSISPLSKSSDKNPEITERFQLVVAGTELVNGFSELNDPLDQRLRMEEQEKQFRAGNEEASRVDNDFLEALEYGMPPAAGIGIGIDRLAAFFTNSHSIREVITFTNLRPK